MNDPYLHSYSILGIRPGSNWTEIRDAYRILVKKWHPDRFQQDSNDRKIAEEKTMEITRAYKTLTDYFREHGSTPSNAPSPTTPSAEPDETSMPFERSGHATTTENTTADITQTRSPTPTPAHATWGKTLFALPTVLLLLYLWLPNEPADRNIDVGTPPMSTVQDQTQPAIDGNTTSPRTGQFFTLGSKLGEVYGIQGVPSKTEEGVWHYGKSRVHFINGGVSRWDSHPDNPLRASLQIDPAAVTKKTLLKRGSTKEEVRTLLGTPWRQTEREWAYGSSRIFFNADLVTGWEESPFNPLKTQKNQ